jgi:phage FluMu protein Com
VTTRDAVLDLTVDGAPVPARAWHAFRCAGCGALLAQVRIVPGASVVIRCRRCGLQNEITARVTP